MKVAVITDEIRKRLKAVNIVSYSGGKDSSVVLSLVLRALVLDPGKKLYIVTSDTGMEIPYYQDYVTATQQKIRDYISGAGINAEVITVKPEPKDTFWSCVLGKGYPAAHMGFRWCSGKLKIDPINKWAKKIAGKNSMTFIGVRAAESPLRAKIYPSKDYKSDRYLPILDWSAADVWEYLMTEPCPWGDYSKLIEVYKFSSDECVYGEKEGVCVGNARYGCWACPLQKESQLDMLAWNTGDKRYLQLKAFKKNLAGLANNTAYRSRIRRNGTEGAGPFLVNVRRMLYRDLRKLEEQTGWVFLSDEESACIQADWEIDEDVHNVTGCKQMELFAA